MLGVIRKDIDYSNFLPVSKEGILFGYIFPVSGNINLTALGQCVYFKERFISFV